jgi:hypothetical protein
LPEAAEPAPYAMTYTKDDNPHRMYDHGCDDLVRRFDEEFAQAFNTVNTEAYERV